MYYFAGKAELQSTVSMKRSPKTEKYWQDFIRSLADKESVPSSYAVYYFGNKK